MIIINLKLSNSNSVLHRKAVQIQLTRFNPSSKLFFDKGEGHSQLMFTSGGNSQSVQSTK